MLRRLPAEWEQQNFIQITFPHENSDWGVSLAEVITTFVELIKTITEFQLCFVICQNKKLVFNYLEGCNQDNLMLLEIPSNDVWARDHGGITILKDGKAVVLDFIFNGWGKKFASEKDNLITKRIFQEQLKDSPKSANLQAALKNMEYLPMNFVLEGGSIESDGKGSLLTTSKCLLNSNRNPQFSKTQIEEKLKKQFSLKRVLWLHHGELIGDDTDAHIDTLARFCNEETIAYVQCLDKNDPHFEELSLMEQELKSFKNLDGQFYDLVPLPMPSPIFDENKHQLPATYANFLIINEAVLVPIYQVAEDVIALQRLQAVFPNRKVIGINCRALIRQGGSLHCATMQFPKI